MKKLLGLLTFAVLSIVAANPVGAVERSAEITSPAPNSIVTNTLNLGAYLIDDDYDPVQWAVRKGTCAAATNTVLGNVDGKSTPFTWAVDGDPYKYNFSASADVTAWEEDIYCFIFNPSEDGGESDIRMTEFFKVNWDADNDGFYGDVDCNDNDATIYPGAPDAICNGIDNDCDGSIDGDYVNTPTSCGVGECAAAGELTCASGSEVDTCTAGSPTTEICDGVDNDCDTSVDEDLTRETTCGVGACSENTGHETCTAGVWGGDTCDPYEGAIDEVCDYGRTKVDDDCDGIIDEDACVYSCGAPIADGNTASMRGWLSLGTNRWIWTTSSDFRTTYPKGTGTTNKSYTLGETNNCSCSQILTWLQGYDSILYGNMLGHWKYGCSISVMNEFIRLTVPPYTIGDVGFNSPWGHVELDFSAYETVPASGEVNWARVTGSINSWSGPVIWTDVVDSSTAYFKVLVDTGTPPQVLGCDITFKVIDNGGPDTDIVQITAVVDDPADWRTCGAVGQVQGPWTINEGNLIVSN